MTKFVVVGFVMTQKESIGYRDFENEGKASQYVYELLTKGADVISVRRVRGE